MKIVNEKAVVLNKKVVNGKTVINCLLPNYEVGTIFISGKQSEYNEEILNTKKGDKILFVGGRYEAGERLPEAEKPLERAMVIGDTLNCFSLPSVTEENDATKELSIYKEVLAALAGAKQLSL